MKIGIQCTLNQLSKLSTKINGNATLRCSLVIFAIVSMVGTHLTGHVSWSFNSSIQSFTIPLRHNRIRSRHVTQAATVRITVDRPSKLESLRTLQNLAESCRILQNFAESCRISQIPKNLTESYRILQNLVESCRISQNPYEFSRILQNLAESLRIL